MNSSESHTVLLVEDEPHDILLTRRAFKKAGIHCDLRVVTNGDEAVDYLGGTGNFADRTKFPLPALVLLDLKLPRRCGLDVLEWVRSRDILRRMPVVILTSSRESEDLSRAYDLGANSYLLKPVSFDDLTRMLTTVNLYWLNTIELPPMV
ncbi:MAG TPA: response regulator [Planctomycetota bacterium]|nr:response regulator [Planctomycetota bacterium]